MKKFWLSPVIALVALLGFNTASALASVSPSINHSSVTFNTSTGAVSGATFANESGAFLTVYKVTDATACRKGGLAFKSCYPQTAFGEGVVANGSATAKVPTCGVIQWDVYTGPNRLASIGKGGTNVTGHHFLEGAITDVGKHCNGVPPPPPVQPRFIGHSACGTGGRWQADYALVGGTGVDVVSESPALPVAHKGLTAKSDHLTVRFNLTRGPSVTKTVVVARKTGCSKPIKLKLPIKRPHARFFGPCLDPEYSVDMWNGVHANHDVTLVWHYQGTFGNGTVGVPTVVRVKLRPGQHFRAQYRRILGNSTMSVRTADGRVVAKTRVVPPGEYGSCAPVV